MQFTEFQSIVLRQVNEIFNVNLYARLKLFKPSHVTNYAADAWLQFMKGEDLEKCQLIAVTNISNYVESVMIFG